MPTPPQTPPFPSHVRAIDDLRGPAGRLEALLNTGRPDALFAALVAHPHPPSGGTMHNKVVFHAMKALNAAGLPVLRFNFRGAGRSEGAHDHGRGEQDDVRAALDWLSTHFRLPILFAGFSFGSYVGLRACCGDPRVHGLIALGLPLHAAGRDYTYDFLSRCTAPKLFITGAEDQFSSRDAMLPLLAAAPGPKQMVWIEAADHFFQGPPASPTPKLDQMSTALRAWLSSEFHLP